MTHYRQDRSNLQLVLKQGLIGVCVALPMSFFVDSVVAQPPSFGERGERSRGGERGGDREGERGGFGRGGDRGSWGGRSEGGRSESGRSESGRSEGGSRFGGGPGGPGGFGGPGGPGGFGGPGGPGGHGGPGGGFDPSAFLSRMDRNGNGMIDSDEMEGPARFMLERIARNNPKIDLSKPIPLSVISEAVQQARGGSSPDAPTSSDEDFSSPTTLVPGFGVKQAKTPVPGFGVNANLLSIRVEERDLRDADERIQRYDRNRDGVLDENELRDGRWNDAPMQFDRNGDGKLNRDELAVRFAKRRTETPAAAPAPAQPSFNSNGGGSQGDQERPQIQFEATASYRLSISTSGSKRLQGLPEWFTNMDTNQDGQVAMSEFIRRPSDEAIVDYGRFDTNMDGFITPQEGLAAVKNGHVPGSSSGSSSNSDSSSRESSSGGRDFSSKGREGRMSRSEGNSPSGPSSTPAATSATSSSKPPASDAERQKMKDWLGGRLTKWDTNKNQRLELDEYQKYNSSGDFSKADLNKDGAVDLDELTEERLRK